MSVNFDKLNNLQAILDLDTDNDLENFIISVQNKISNKFLALLKEQPSECPKLQLALEYTILGNGKRLRPALLYAAAEFIINNKPRCEKVINNYIINKTIDQLLLNSAASIELIHTYSLVHDDLPCIDNDDL